SRKKSDFDELQRLLISYKKNERICSCMGKFKRLKKLAYKIQIFANQTGLELNVASDLFYFSILPSDSI
ncbi:hypothetical protein OB13_09200, partial [Pontibacter sp. HJ8]